MSIATLAFSDVRTTHANHIMRHVHGQRSAACAPAKDRNRRRRRRLNDIMCVYHSRHIRDTCIGHSYRRRCTVDDDRSLLYWVQYTIEHFRIRYAFFIIIFIIIIWPCSTKPVGTKTLRKWNSGLQRASWQWTCFEMKPYSPSVVPQTAAGTGRWTLWHHL